MGSGECSVSCALTVFSHHITTSTDTATTHKTCFIPVRMFANYPAGVFSSKPRFKFEFVEEKRHPDYALLGDVLEDIKKRTSGLIAERNRLTAENAQLADRVKALESQLAACEQSKAEAPAPAPPLPTPPAHSSNPVVGERIRALVEEIDACIALMPRSRDMASAEIMTA